MKKKLYVVIILLVFVIVSQMHEVLSLIPGISEAYHSMSKSLPFPFTGEIRNLLQIVIVFIALVLINCQNVITSFKEIGLNRPIIPAMLFGLAATLPMWIIFGITTPVAEEFHFNNVFFLAFLSPLAEEIIFRGFAFGQIRRRANWKFWPAAITTALVFGVGHIGFSQEPGQALGIFLITGVGGILFAWIYEKWDYNLWVPFFLHCLMNLNWQVFDVGESAFAGWLPTTLQVTVVIAAILITLHNNHLPGFFKLH